jgi:hypothetical protein
MTGIPELLACYTAAAIGFSNFSLSFIIGSIVD